MRQTAITGVVLAGGEGRRMGGIDKGLQPLDGRPLVAWVLEALVPQVDAVLVSANRNIDRYAAFGYPVVADAIAGFAGPLAGLHAAMARADTPLVLCVPCDSPFLPADLAVRLLASLEARQAEIAVPRAGGRIHRAFCLARRELLPELEAFLVSGERRVGLWHESLSVAEADFEDEAGAFANINSPDDLMRCVAGRR